MRYLRFDRLLVAGIVAAAAAWALTQVAQARPTEPVVPTAIRVEDGNKVRVGDGVTVDASAIPWLLLSAASTSAGLDGARLVETTFIQRIETTGGLTPPAADCNTETAGTVTEVPYTADYYFWKAKR